MTPPAHDRAGRGRDGPAVRTTTPVPNVRDDERSPGAARPGRVLAADLLPLQQSAGNRATSRLLHAGPSPAPRGSEPAPRRTRPPVSENTFMGPPPARALVVGAAPVQRQGAKAKGKGKGASKKVAHATGKEVDAFLVANPFLKPYAEAKTKAGTKAEGAVKIHDAAAFKKEWVSYALKRTNPDTGKTFTKAEANSWESKVNAFQAPGAIHIHQSRGERGTAIHESMHLYSSTGFQSAVGFNVNEGSTEYFTRMVTKQQKITRGTFYPSQLASVTKLVGVSSDTKLADAYFKNQLDPVKKDVNAKGKKGEKSKRWDLWLTNMKAGQYAKADKQLT